MSYNKLSFCQILNIRKKKALFKKGGEVNKWEFVNAANIFIVPFTEREKSIQMSYPKSGQPEPGGLKCTSRHLELGISL